MTQANVTGAHLVGSINFDTAEETMRTAAAHLGDHLKRIPDGEVGERFHWIAFQPGRLAKAEGLEQIGDQPILLRTLDLRQIRISEGVNAADLKIANLGYADAALESYAVFARLQEEGVIPAGIRFQVSLPTPLATLASFVREEDRADLEPVYEAALAAELEQILAAIPHDKLAVQWDAALEFAILEQTAYAERGGKRYEWFDDVWTGTSERLARQLDRIPADVEAGVHLCYGDVAEKHFVEPKDAANLTKFANLVAAATQRDINWVHLPVPIERDDAEFYAPLAELTLAPTTELYVGLVHREDGAEGASRRLAAARQHLTRDFGVATECGFGRSPEGTTVPLFEAHRAVAAAW